MQQPTGMRGDQFIDRLGGWTEVLLALVSAGIVIARLRKEVIPSDIALLVLFLIEVVGAFAIMRTRIGPMRFAFWLFLLRSFAGIGYMGVVHGDKLAKSTLGFPIVIALYCWVRVRALRAADAERTQFS